MPTNSPLRATILPRSYGPVLRLGWLVAMVLIIGTLQYLATSTQRQWIYVLQRLCYIPVVVAGLIIGWRGGLARLE
jgi:hypothetical protein